MQKTICGIQLNEDGMKTIAALLFIQVTEQFNPEAVGSNPATEK